MSGVTPDLHKSLQKSIILETLGSFRRKVGNLAPHELAEEGHCEIQVAVAGTVDHAFVDQCGAAGTQTADFDLEQFGKITDAAGLAAQFCHSTQKKFFCRSQSVESDTEEVFIESLGDGGPGTAHNIQREGAGFGLVPSLVSPLLKKIGIALRELHHFLQGVGLVADAKGGHWVLQGFAKSDLDQLNRTGESPRPERRGFESSP